MDFLKLKKQKIVFVGAFIKDEEAPKTGRAIIDLESRHLQITSSPGIIVDKRLVDIVHDRLNDYVSHITFKTDYEQVIFHVGIFPYESTPIDNVSDSIKETYYTNDSKSQNKILAELGKDYGHSIIEYMVKTIKDQFIN